MSKLLEVLVPDIPKEKTESFFDTADANRDGQIDYAEFLAYIFKRDRYQKIADDSSKPVVKPGKQKLDPSIIYFSSDSVLNRFQIQDGPRLAANTLQTVVDQINLCQLELEHIPMLEVFHHDGFYYAADDFHNRLLYVLQTCFSGEKLLIHVQETPAKFNPRGDGMNVRRV